MSDDQTTSLKKAHLVVAGVSLALVVGVGSFLLMVATADWDRLAEFHAKQERKAGIGTYQESPHER